MSKIFSRVHFIALLVTGAIALVAVSSPTWAQSRDTVMTGNVVPLRETVSPNGFVHPGISCNAETLSVMREKVAAGVSPWVDYFEGLRRTPYARLDRKPRLVEQITNDGEINRFADDAQTAWTHTILYVVTGNEEYRKRPVEIIQWYGGRTDKSFFPVAFPDSHIKIGKYVYTLCSAVDILRTIEPKDAHLAVTAEMVDAFSRNCIDPIRKNCIERNSYFMNQHSYAIMGFLAGAVLADDVEGYKRAVEWTTVNATAENQGRNGSIKQQVRLVTRNDKTGQTVLPNLQLAEMGRDQPHACGNIDNLLMMVKTIDFQKTRVDPVDGTVTQSPAGISPVHFLDDRLLKGQILYIKYNMGYGLPWVPTYSESSPDNTATFDQISYFGRGSIGGSGIQAGYFFYRGMGYNLDNGPYALLGAAYKATQVNREFESRSGTFINQVHNYAFDFWIGLSASASDAAPDPEKAKRALAAVLPPLEVVRDGVRVEANQFEYNFIDLSAHAQPGDIYPGSDKDVPLQVQRDADGTAYVRVTLNRAPRSLVTTLRFPEQAALRVRSDKIVRLSFYSSEDYANRPARQTIYVSQTGGAWTDVSSSVASGSLVYIEVTSLDGPARVDFDRVDTDPAKVIPLAFAVNARDASVPAFVGRAIEKTYATAKQDVVYSATGLPTGATLDSTTGKLTWTPQADQTGDHAFYLTAKSAVSSCTLPVTIHVEKDLQSALEDVARIYQPSDQYESATLASFKAALEAKDLDRLTLAADQLRLLTPKLSDGSLDYCQTWSATINGSDKMADNDPLTWGGLWGFDKSITMDFGKNFKVKSQAFGLQARDGFPIRVSQAVVYGSNNRFDWTLLTETPAKVSPDFQRLEVRKDLQDKPYRFLRFFMPAKAYGIFEIAKLRLYAQRIEDFTPDYHKAYIWGFDDGTFRPDQALTRAEAATFLANAADDYTDRGAYSCDFTDVDRNASYYDDLAYMTQKGLIRPVGGKIFSPDSPITRGELAGIMSRMSKLDGRVELSLPDVPSTMPDATEIHRVVARGWLSADKDKAFRPAAPVTRAEFVVAVNAMLGRTDTGAKTATAFKDVATTYWAHDAIMEASQTHPVE